MKSIIIILLLLSIFGVSACTEERQVNEANSKIVTDNIEDSQLFMEKVSLFTIKQYINEEDRNIYEMFFVMEDGCIYTMNYATNVGGSDDNNFLKKLSSFDNCIWGLANEIEKVGKISDNEVKLFRESISKVNIDSDYFKIDNDKMPEVEEVMYYKIYCCIKEKDNNKNMFCIKKNGKNIGKLYETYDKEALKVFEVLKSNPIFVEWSDGFFE